MAIRSVTVDPSGGKHKTTFKDSTLAHDLLDNITGIELGCSDHNGFHLPGSINVAPDEQVEFYRQSQIDTNGKYAEIDVFDDGETLVTFSDNSQGYVLSSHVIEHLPNPIKCLMTWNRVCKDGAYIYITAPLRGSHPPDKDRDFTSWGDWKAAYDFQWTPETVPWMLTAAAGGPRGHYGVFTCETLKSLIADTCREFDLDWELVAEEDPDKKVGNGFTLVYKVKKTETVTPKPGQSHQDALLGQEMSRHDDIQEMKGALNPRILASMQEGYRSPEEYIGLNIDPEIKGPMTLSNEEVKASYDNLMEANAFFQDSYSHTVDGVVVESGLLPTGRPAHV